MEAFKGESKPDQVLDSFELLREPTPLQRSRLQSLQAAAMNLGLAIQNCVPPGADRSAAMRKVREAMMTASAGIVLGPEQF